MTKYNAEDAVVFIGDSVVSGFSCEDFIKQPFFVLEEGGDELKFCSDHYKIEFRVLLNSDSARWLKSLDPYKDPDLRLFYEWGEDDSN